MTPVSVGLMLRSPIVAFAAAGAIVLSSALAAEWPSKPVRLIVPFAAGGAADTIGRLYAEALGAAFGKPFYVENRVGGGGLLGTEAVARAEPDGLTLMVSGIPTHVLGPAMNKNVGFDPMRDFTHSAPCTSLARRDDLPRFSRAGARGQRHRIGVGRVRHHGQLDRRVPGGKGKDQAGARRLQGRRTGGGWSPP